MNGTRVDVEGLEQRELLTMVGFVPHTVVQSENSIAGVVVARDWDSDGDLDVLVGSNHDEIKVFENIDGEGSFAASRPIEIKSPYLPGPQPNILDIRFYDADADGDDDLYVFLGSFGRLALVMENLDGEDFSEPITIGVVSDFDLADINGDGKTDVVTSGTSYVSTSDGTLAYEERTSPTLAPSWHMGWGMGRHPFLGDIDGDDNIDLIGVEFNDSKGELDAFWYDNKDGSGNFQNRTVIGPSCDGISVEDIDSDGDLDVASCDGLWYENADATGGFVQRQMGLDLWAPQPVFFDLDADGDLDALFGNLPGSAEHGLALGELYWALNDGNENFQAQLLYEGASSQVLGDLIAADLDGDGDLDAIASFAFADDHVQWFENIDGAGNFEPPRAIGSSLFQTPIATVAVDMDGDEDVDLFSLARGDGKLYWFENTNGTGEFSPAIEIDGEGRYLAANIGDFDGDGDPDIVATLPTEDQSVGYQVTWLPNLGNGQFGEPTIIDALQQQPIRSVVADVDGDGDDDLLVLSHELIESEYDWAWYENTNGLGGFSSRKAIQINPDPTSHLDFFIARDIDQDGQLIVHSNYGDTDFDGDGDFDVLASQLGTIVWYPNTNGELGSAVPIEEGDNLVSQSAFATDMDEDGDNDLLVGMVDLRRSEDGTAIDRQPRLIWYENLNGLGTFGNPIVISDNVESVSAVGAADFDGDGDLDPFSADSTLDKIEWFEKRLAGDADDNGDVSFADFLVLSANFGKQVDAVWADGDFDGNRKVDFSDFLILSSSFGARR